METETEAWSSERPTSDGIYLSAFDEEDEDPDVFHVKGGQLFKPDGQRWVSYGGIWKRIGDLPK